MRICIYCGKTVPEGEAVLAGRSYEPPHNHYSCPSCAVGLNLPGAQTLRGAQELAKLKDAINEAWKQMYNHDSPVDDIDALVKRIRLIADDRNCWLHNAKYNQKEYLKLEAIIKERNEHETNDT